MVPVASAAARPDESKAGRAQHKVIEPATVVADTPRIDAAMVKKIGEATLDGAMLASEQILARWPAATHVYVGVGRSPALITAYLDARGCTTCTVPLSGFKHGTVMGSGGRPPLEAEQEAQLASHFGRYLIPPSALAGRDIVVIDFAMSAGGAIASYNYIHRYYTGPSEARSDRDAFYENLDLAPRWGYDYDDSNFASLQIQLAILCSRSNRDAIQGIVATNVADHKQWPDLGDVSRLRDDHYLLVTPQDEREDALMGKLDNAALKSYSKHGRQSDASRVAGASYLALVELFRARRSAVSGGASGGAAAAASGGAPAAAGSGAGASGGAPSLPAEHKQKQKLPTPEDLFAMLEAGVGLDRLAFEYDGKRGGPARDDRAPAHLGAAAAVHPPAAALAAAPAPKLPVEPVARLKTAIENAIPVVNGELLTQDAAKVQPIKAALVALLVSVGAATTLDELIACLTGVKDALEALAKVLPVKAASRRLAGDIATRAEGLLANTRRRSQRD
jgi:hypothetical protein